MKKDCPGEKTEPSSVFKATCKQESNPLDRFYLQLQTKSQRTTSAWSRQLCITRMLL